MLLLVLGLLVAVLPIISTVMLIAHSVFLWQRRRPVRDAVREAVAELLERYERGETDQTPTRQRSGAWRFSDAGDLKKLWWQSPFDYVTVDDYLSDVVVRRTIDLAARAIAERNTGVEKSGLTSV